MFILFIFALMCGAIASLIGVGSSLMMLPLILYAYPLLTGMYFDIQTVAAATLILTFFSTSVASIRYHRLKLIPYRYALLLGSSGAIGSFVGGAFVSKYINHTFSLILFGCMIILSFMFNLIPRKNKEGQPPIKGYFTFGTTMLFFLGIVTGIIGVGGMAIFIPYMIYALKFSVRKTIVTTTFIGAIISLFGLLGKSSIGVVDWEIGIAIAIGGTLGGYVGASLNKFFPERVLNWGMNIILFLIMVTVWIDIISLFRRG
jgi:uncharacterized membrane protein YfcA